MDRHSESESGVRVLFEFWVAEIGHHRLAQVQLDDVRSIDTAQELPRTPLVKPEHWGNIRESTLVEIERSRGKLADKGFPASRFQNARLAEREQQRIRLQACPFVSTKNALMSRCKGSGKHLNGVRPSNWESAK